MTFWAAIVFESPPDPSTDALLLGSPFFCGRAEIEDSITTYFGPFSSTELPAALSSLLKEHCESGSYKVRWDDGTGTSDTLAEQRVLSTIGQFTIDSDTSGNPGPHTLILPAGLGFGDGQHPTTRMCVELLEEYSRSYEPPEHIFDVGAGSGILSVVAQRLFPSSTVVACEIDPVACSYARSVIIQNKVHVLLTCSSWSCFRARPSLVVANIYSDLLRALMTDKSLLGQHYLVSGCSPDEIHSLCDATGTQLIELHPKCDEWGAALILRDSE